MTAIPRREAVMTLGLPVGGLTLDERRQRLARLFREVETHARSVAVILETPSHTCDTSIELAIAEIQQEMADLRIELSHFRQQLRSRHPAR